MRNFSSFIGTHPTELGARISLATVSPLFNLATVLHRSHGLRLLVTVAVSLLAQVAELWLIPRGLRGFPSPLSGFIIPHFWRFVKHFFKLLAVGSQFCTESATRAPLLRSLSLDSDRHPITVKCARVNIFLYFISVCSRVTCFANPHYSQGTQCISLGTIILYHKNGIMSSIIFYFF